MSIQPRRAILSMPEYHPPLGGRNALRLDFNENTHAPSPRVREALSTLTLESFTIYPERGPVEAKVAAHFGLQSEQVLLANGTDEGIHLVTYTFLEEGDECLFATPSFFMYDVNAMAMGATLVRVQSDASLAFPYDRVLASITPKTKMIILCSPNNPTGVTITREQILTIAKAAPHAVVLVDEAYFHFFGESVLQDVVRGDVGNILIARTFSKAYGLANLRVGAIAGPVNLVNHLRKASSPYNVNGIALMAVAACVDDTEYLDWYVGQIRDGRERVYKTLDNMRVPYWQSQANFVLMHVGPRHKEFVEAMRARGVLVRDRSSDPGLQGCVRITIGLEEHTTVGIASLRDTFAGMGWTPSEVNKPDESPKETPEYE